MPLFVFCHSGNSGLFATGSKAVSGLLSMLRLRIKEPSIVSCCINAASLKFAELSVEP